ncbi:MAG: 50S ribosomal protein L23 [Candidatus Sungbacteria bacterium]|uniref:Large ribosomal subunit protein uL23 n=1 Tax=Candidatus Sungiibacteriota bacterium TaxID=2750080 RepID=A0A933DT54_9BACT|nr:50S ribosomal protein L23 [Candidatus Sungbacteria bacterium]
MIFNPFKKAKTPPGARPPAAESKKDTPTASPPRESPRQERRWVGVLVAPHLTEKTSNLNSQGWYTFRVAPQASKILVRKAVEERYGVSVERVRMAAARTKKIRLGRIIGQTPGFKKAVVKVAAGQKIDFTS